MKTDRSQLSQIPLQFGNFQKNDFSNFLTGQNKNTVEQLYKVAANEMNHCIYLWGNAATGKSHLLQAVCKYASEHDRRVAYVPLEQIDELSPEILQDLGDLDLVCIDDLDFVCGKKEWQQSMVWLYNELRDNQHSLLMSAGVAPTSIDIELEDLKSRLGWDQVYQLIPPDDDLKIEILKQNATARSFELSNEVIDYLITRVDRDLCSLMQILDQIDHASLAAKRKITIPFVKEIIG